MIPDAKRNEIALKLRQAMVKGPWTHSELAATARVDPKSLRKALSGDNTTSPAVLQKVAQTLDVDLVGYVQPPLPQDDPVPAPPKEQSSPADQQKPLHSARLLIDLLDGTEFKRSLTVHLFNGRSVQSVLDDCFYLLIHNGVPVTPYQYGRQWRIVDNGSGAPFLSQGQLDERLANAHFDPEKSYTIELIDESLVELVRLSSVPLQPQRHDARHC